MIENPKELKFLIWLSRNPKKHIPIKYSNLKWEAVIEYAGRNKLVPFFHHIINCPSCQKKVPQKQLKGLKKDLLGAFFNYTLQEREKEKLSKILNKQKIQIVLLKDIQAYNIKYPSYIFPQKFDIDFFIPKISRKKLKLLKLSMKKMGYKLHKPLTPKHLLSDFDQLELNYIKKDSPTIEFHLKKILPKERNKTNPITENVNNQFTSMFTRSIHDLGNYSLASYELHLLAWCWHFFSRDSCRGLRTIFDIAQFCKQKRVDWKKTLRIANQLKLSPYFLFVIAVADRTYKLKLPPSVTRAISENKKVKLGLKLYSPILTAYGEQELFVPKTEKDVTKYLFLIKLVLWEKPIIFKIGPRALFYSFYYFPSVFLKLKRLERSL